MLKPSLSITSAIPPPCASSRSEMALKLVLALALVADAFVVPRAPRLATMVRPAQEKDTVASIQEAVASFQDDIIKKANEWGAEMNKEAAPADPWA